MGSAICPWDSPIRGFPGVETFDVVLADNAKAFQFVGTTTDEDMAIVVVGSGMR